MKELTADINLDHEVAAMAEFISQKWTPIPGIEALFREIRDAALHDARAWLDHYTVSECAHELRKQREALLGDTVDAPFLYDAACSLLSEVGLYVHRVGEQGRDIDGKWDYSRSASRVYNRLVTKYPDLATTRPHGWDALAQGYSDFDGQEEYEPGPDREMFQGTDVRYVCSPSFPGAVALPYVMYDEKCQGRKAPRVLVGAVYSQFLGIIAFLNAHRACEALRQIPALTIPTQVFEVLIETDNPFVKVLQGLARAPVTREEYAETLARKAEFDALSEEEKAARKAANEARVAEQLMAMFSKKPDPEAEAREASRQATALTLLREVFGQ